VLLRIAHCCWVGLGLGSFDLSPHSRLVKYTWKAITLPRSLPIVAQGRAEGTSEISLLGCASPSKKKANWRPLKGCPKDASLTLHYILERSNVSCFIPLSSTTASMKDLNNTNNSLLLHCVGMQSQAMFYSNEKQE
jgi:hypothetical protein